MRFLAIYTSTLHTVKKILHKTQQDLPSLCKKISWLARNHRVNIYTIRSYIQFIRVKDKSFQWIFPFHSSIYIHRHTSSEIQDTSHNCVLNQHCILKRVTVIQLNTWGFLSLWGGHSLHASANRTKNNSPVSLPENPLPKHAVQHCLTVCILIWILPQ